MKLIKRITCYFLILAMMASLIGCGKKKKTDEDIEFSRGEFFSYFVYDNNMSSDIYSVEDIRNCNDGSVEAKILVEWGYLDESESGNLDKPVDKETVVSVCAKAIPYLKSGDTTFLKILSLLLMHMPVVSLTWNMDTSPGQGKCPMLIA